MAIQIDRPSLAAVRRYLDETMYAAVDLRLSFEVGGGPTAFPSFRGLQEAVKRLDSRHQVLFRLLRLGEAVDTEALRHAVPERIFTALAATRLLVRSPAGGWRTPSLLVVPAEGMNLLVSIPPFYPTATAASDTWLDLSSYVIARALPASLAGEQALDACSGSGFQALLCAARGATRVVGLEINEEAVATASAAAVLNGLDGKVEFRRSDALASLEEGERFDFVVCNTPYDPVIEGLEPPSGPERIGNSVVWRLLDRLPFHLSERGRGILGSWRAAGNLGSTYQMQAIASRLEKQGCSTTAFVDRTADTVENVLRILRNDLEERPGAEPSRVDQTVDGVRRLLQRPSSPIDGFYNQIIYFQKGAIESAAQREIFGLLAPPPA
jgi:hypothetical protein